MENKTMIGLEPIAFDDTFKFRYRCYPDLLNLNQLCKMFRMKKLAVYRLLRTHRITAHKAGKEYRINKTCALEYLLTH